MKIEGRNAVREAVNAGTTFSKVMVSKGDHDKVFNDLITLLKSKNVKLQWVSPDVIMRESDTKHAQGVIAFADEYKYADVSDILALALDKGEDPFILILDGIEDPHNFGSIIRVAECMGVHGIIFGKNRACQVTETVVRTSAGASSHMLIARVTNINTEIERLKKQNIWVYSCELGGENIVNSNLTGPLAIVIGSEGFGTSRLTKELCDGVVTIPMVGKVNSLNASVATGMAVYEAFRQRHYGR